MNVPAQVGGGTPLWYCEFEPRSVENGTYILSKAVIAKAADGSGYYLFDCTSDWQTVFDTWYESFDLALSAAVEENPGAEVTGIHLRSPSNNSNKTSLIACKICGGKMRAEARVCPHCGPPDAVEVVLAEKVRMILGGTNVLEAMLFVSKQTGWSLKEVKDFVDSLR